MEVGISSLPMFLKDHTTNNKRAKGGYLALADDILEQEDQEIVRQLKEDKILRV